MAVDSPGTEPDLKLLTLFDDAKIVNILMDIFFSNALPICA